MATEAEIASALGTINAFDLVPLWLQEISGLVRTVALVVGAAVIPLIIWRSGVRRDEHARSSASSIEKRRATFELIPACAD